MKTFFIFLICLLSSVLSIAQSPRILWWFDTNDSSFGQSAIGDIDQDNKYEIVFGCFRNDSMIYTLNAEDGTLHWKYNTGGLAEGCNDVAALLYDVTGDGYNEVIVPSSCNPITYCFNGSNGALIWQTATRGSDSPPVIADLDLDGNYEILHGEFGGWVRCINAASGITKWELLVDADSWVQTAPTIVDINQDGTLDFVVATWGFSNNSRMYAYNGITRELLWSIPMEDVVYHGTAVADLDNDGKPELVIGDYSGKLHVINAEDGSYAWNYQTDYYIGAPAVIGDLNGDGHCEIIIVSWFNVIALNYLGGIVWQYSIPSYGSSLRGTVLADITNDSLPEVIFGSDNGSLYALNGTNGSLLWSVDLQAHYGNVFKIDHAPVIADFNGDDTLDLFIQGGNTNYPDFTNNYGRGYALTIGKGAGPEWKMFQHDYYRSSSLCGTEVINSVKDDGIKLIKEFVFDIYPSPIKSSGILHINADNDIISKFIIMDIAGRRIAEFSNKKEIQLADLNLSEGIYLLQCINQYGMQTRRFIISDR